MTQHIVINAENVCEFDCQDLPLMDRLSICLAVISGGTLKLRSQSVTITTQAVPEAKP